MNNLLLSSKTQGTLISTKLSCRSVFSLQFLRKKLVFKVKAVSLFSMENMTENLSWLLIWKVFCLSTWQLIKFSLSGLSLALCPFWGQKNTCPGCHLLKLWHHKAPPLFWSEGTSVLWAPVPSGWFVSAIIPWNRSGKWFQCEDRNWWQTEWGWAEGLA